MKRLGKSKINELGSMMVEALAMLGLISMVTPVVYKKAAERNTEMQDVNAAAQLRTLVRAVDEYIQDNYDKISNGDVVENSCLGANSVNFNAFKGTGEQHQLIELNHLCDYLPYGFLDNAGTISDNRLFSKDYKLSIKKIEGANAQKALTGFLVAQPTMGKDFSRIRASRISSMIGGNGGFVKDGNAYGVQGMWEVDNISGNLGIPTVADGSIITTSAQPISAGKADYDEVLHRYHKRDRAELNRMETSLFMGSSGSGGQNIENVNRIVITAANNAPLGVEEMGGGWQDKALWIKGVGAGAYIDGMLQSAQGKFVVDKESNVKTQGALSAAADKFTVDKDSNVKTQGALSAAADKFTVDVNGNTVAKGTLSVADKKFVVSSDGSFKASNEEFTVNNKGDTVMGKAYNAADTSYKLTVNGNAIIRGLLRLGKLKADNIDAGTLRAGTTTALLETSSNRQDYTLFTDNTRLVVGATSAADNVGVFNVERAGYTYAKGLRAGLVNGSLYPFTVENDANANITMNLRGATSSIAARNTANNADLLRINNSTSSMQAYTGASQRAQVELNSTGVASLSATTTGNVSEVYLDANQASIGVGGATGADKNLIIYKSGATATGAARPQIWVRNGTDLKVLNAANNDVIFNVDQSGVLKDDYSKTGAQGRGSVYVRKGVIELASKNGNGVNPTFVNAADDTGYVKADMLIAPKTLETNTLASGYNYFPNFKEYNAYMVNPAYTSVMHDIKLTTRGGARLSDILPDFVNKGIYLADNTYTEGSMTEAKLNSVEPPTGTTITDTNTQQASAWLGSVPPPQCPPGYEKVITVVPMSFKMAEAESVWGDSRADNFYHFRDAHEQIPGYENPYHPSVDYQPTPLTFQKNTFLKVMSVQHGDATTFKGWSVLMGFIYPISEYKEIEDMSGAKTASKYYAKYAGQTLQNNTNNYVWNLYPVYANTLESLVTVYCFFRRSAFSNGSNQIDSSYDYLKTLNGRTLTDKPTGFKNRLNDPKLDYNTPW